MELADLAARAMLVWSRDGMPITGAFWDFWAARISARPELERGRFGLKVFPDVDIREAVIAMREQVLRKKGEA